MIVNVRLDVTDDQRRALASLLAGRPVRRMATRAEVVDLLGAALAGLSEGGTGTSAPPPEAPGAKAGMTEAARAPLTPRELAEAERLAKAGKTAGYVRGWILAGRIIRTNKQA